MQNKQVWRYDEYLRKLEKVEVDANIAPIGVWLPAWVGDGDYIYLEDFASAKKVSIEDIELKIRDLQELLVLLHKMEEGDFNE